MWEVQFSAVNRKGGRVTQRWKFKKPCELTLAGQVQQVYPNYRLVKRCWKQVTGCAV